MLTTGMAHLIELVVQVGSEDTDKTGSLVDTGLLC